MDNEITNDDAVLLNRRYLMQTYTYSPEIMFVKGKGAILTDSTGKDYLDFASGISVCNLGHCHPAVTAAIKKQAAKLVHVSNLFINENQPRLAAKLIGHCFDGVVFFCNSGAEANEGMIKFARKHGSASGKHEIIVMEESFHGRTLATLAATGRKKYREGFQPDMSGFVHVPFNNLDAVKNAVNEKTCAVMLEPVQGEGGIIPVDPDYLKSLRAFCDEKGLLLLFDEVQCGMGRTGSFFAWQNYGVEPDAVSLAKALGNGFPIGAFIVKRKYEKILGAGTHATTFGGTPLACAAGLAVIDTFDGKNVLANCISQGKLLFGKLAKLAKKFDCIREIRGKGLMAGIVFENSAAPLKAKCTENGLIVLTAGENVLRLLPPLTITAGQVRKAVDIIEKSIIQTMGSEQCRKT